MDSAIKRNNQAFIERLCRRTPRLRVSEEIAHRRNEGKPVDPPRYETERKNPRRQRAKLIKMWEQRLYLTHWGKMLARQGQVKAAAKQAAIRQMAIERGKG